MKRKAAHQGPLITETEDIGAAFRRACRSSKSSPSATMLSLDVEDFSRPFRPGC